MKKDARWKALLVDDEPSALRELERHLQPYPEIEIVARAHTLKAARHAIAEHQPDLWFLDIQLGNRSGFELIDDGTVQSGFRVVLFVTAYDRYAIDAFDRGGVDYLLKPFRAERFAQSMERLEGLRRMRSGTSSISTGRDGAKMLIAIDGVHHHLSLAEVSCVQAQGDYTEVYTSNGKLGLALMPLKDWEDRLGMSTFLKLSRSALIRIDAVRRIETLENGTLSISGEGIPGSVQCSRRRRKEVMNRLAHATGPCN